MADFKTHITVSSVLGVGYGATAYAMFDVPVATCLLASGMCGISGMLPDLDSGPGRPLRESMAFAAAVVPMMLSRRLMSLGLSHEWIILSGAALYLLIRFGVAELLRLYTVHRGMFHSIPAAIIAGEFAFLLAAGEDVNLRIYIAGAVGLGYLSHLILDEIWSFQWSGGRVRLKQSFGSALKIVGPSTWGNISAGAKLLVLSFIIVQNPNWLGHTQPRSQPTVAERRPAETAPTDEPTARTASPWYRSIKLPGLR